MRRASAVSVCSGGLCDPQFEDCRAPLFDLIPAERQGIGVAFWYMADLEIANELVKAFNNGVPVRVLMDQRANATKRLNPMILSTLRDAGIPMREKFSTTEDILLCGGLCKKGARHQIGASRKCSEQIQLSRMAKPKPLNTTPACAKRISRMLNAAAPTGPSHPTNMPYTPPTSITKMS